MSGSNRIRLRCKFVEGTALSLDILVVSDLCDFDEGFEDNLSNSIKVEEKEQQNLIFVSSGY